jgi:transposase
MHRRTWDAKTKVMIVLQGLQGKPVAAICNEHQISQSQYYQWRDQFLAHADKAFEVHQQSQKETREECLWLQEWTSPDDLIRAFESWMAYYNNHYLHSALGDKTPRQFELDYQHSHGTPFVAA